MLGHGKRLDELRLAGLADVNLVVSAVGFPAAAELKKMYGRPGWWEHLWAGEHPGRLAECIRQAARTGENQSLFDGAGYVPSWDADACIRPDLGLADLLRIYPAERFLSLGNRS